MAWWAGLRWGKTDGSRATTAILLTDTLRKATGRPKTYPDGRTQGTNTWDLTHALNIVFPWMRVTHGYFVADEISELLMSKDLALSVPVWLPDVPARARRFSGGGAIGHQVSIPGARRAGSGLEWLYLDPLGPQGYSGDWVTVRALWDALYTYGTKANMSYMERLDHMNTTISVRRALPAGTTGVVPKGAGRFRFRDGEFQRVQDATESLAGQASYVADVARQPRKGGPSGGFVYFVAGPKLGGVFVRLKDTELTVAQAPDMEAEYQRGLDDGASSEAMRYAPVQEALYQLTEEDDA